MKTTLSMRAAACAFLLGGAWLSGPAMAQSGEYQHGYREGFDRGFKEGYERAQREGGGNPPPGAMVVPVPKRGIVVLRAWYGDEDRRTCNLTGWAARHFNGRTSQSVSVTNELCGDPAPGERKSLTVEYMCGGETRKQTAYEHRTLSLSCY